MPRPLRTCSEPGCPAPVERGACAKHEAERRQARDARRPSPAARGYGAAWRRFAREWVKGKRCVDCGGPAQVPDHDPVPRRTLVELGVDDPDDPRYLRPRCIPCHNSKTARTGA